MLNEARRIPAHNALRLPRSGTTLFASFSGKRRVSLVLEALFYWGQAPKPPGSASPSFGYAYIVFREAEQRFLLLFLEKEESHQY
jgi:hypothetical protein